MFDLSRSPCFFPHAKKHPHCGLKRDTANKRTAQHRQGNLLCTWSSWHYQIAGRAPIFSPLFSATFTCFICILPCARVAGGVSRAGSGALASIYRTRDACFGRPRTTFFFFYPPADGEKYTWKICFIMIIEGRQPWVRWISGQHSSLQAALLVLVIYYMWVSFFIMGGVMFC